MPTCVVVIKITHSPGIQASRVIVVWSCVHVGGDRQREGGDCGEATGRPALPSLDVPAICQAPVSLPLLHIYSYFWCPSNVFFHSL